MSKLTHIVLHCSDSEFGSASEIRRWHLQNGWKDIGYHFVICNGVLVADTVNQRGLTVRAMDGAIEVGRYLNGDSIISGNEVGAHALGYNAKSIGICMIGVLSFTDLQFSSLARLLNELQGRYGITNDMVLGHYDVANKTCPNFDVKQFVNTIPKMVELIRSGNHETIPAYIESKRRYRLGA